MRRGGGGYGVMMCRPAGRPAVSAIVGAVKWSLTIEAHRAPRPIVRDGSVVLVARTQHLADVTPRTDAEFLEHTLAVTSNRVHAGPERSSDFSRREAINESARYLGFARRQTEALYPLRARSRAPPTRHTLDNDYIDAGR